MNLPATIRLRVHWCYGVDPHQSLIVPEDAIEPPTDWFLTIPTPRPTITQCSPDEHRMLNEFQSAPAYDHLSAFVTAAVKSPCPHEKSSPSTPSHVLLPFLFLCSDVSKPPPSHSIATLLAPSTTSSPTGQWLVSSRSVHPSPSDWFRVESSLVVILFPWCIVA